MEANKDSAEELFQIAQVHFTNQKFEEALIYFERSKKLFPLQNVDTFIEKCKLSKGKSSTNSKPNTSTQDSKPQEKKEVPQSNHTQEELKEIKEIINCKDYYQILGVSKTANKDEIKRAYMKKAMKFHPDRNTCPGAEDAFKNISSAYSCLSDEKKKKFYDQYGTEDVQRIQQNFPRRQNFQQFSHVFEGDDFDDILRHFFQNQHRQRDRQTQRRRNRDDEREEFQSPFGFIFQFLPLLILILLPTLLNMFSSFTPTAPFSTQKTDVYHVERMTSDGHLPYYVRESFNYDWPRYYRSIYQLENQVVIQTIREVDAKCREEQDLKVSAIKEAQWYFRGEERTQKIEEAEKLETKSCERLSELRSMYSR